MTLDDLKLICDKANIPFKNQNIGGLLSDLQTKYFKPKREHITEELRQLILKEQNYKCNACNVSLTEKYELDHIKPVSNGGGNDRKNLNMLCVACHREKTDNEHTEYIKQNDFSSCLNIEAKRVLQSNFSKKNGVQSLL
jgi:hypothetical protein